MLNHYGSVTPLLRMSKKPPLTVLSSGAGQDSAALLALCLEDPAFQRRYIPGDLLVMMSATGNEHHETDRYRQRSADLCAERGVPFIHVTPDLGFHSPAWQTLHHQWSRHDSIQSRLFPKSCSDSLKIQPFYKALNAHLAERYHYPTRVGHIRKAALYSYAQDFGPIQVMIGFARKEEKRVKPAPSKWMQQTVERIFPLIDLGLDRNGCQETTRGLGHEVPFPSNCQHCPFHRPIDLVRLHKGHPESFELWAQFEDRKLAKWVGTRNHTVFGNDLTLRQNLDKALVEFGHLDTAELDAIRMQRGHGNSTPF